MAEFQVYSKGQIARQNVLTLFRWIESGSLKKTELKNAVSLISKQLAVLKEECVLDGSLYAAVYECLDDNLFSILERKYEFEGNNGPLLNRLFVEAGQGRKTGVNTPSPSRPWLDIENILVDCLANEALTCCGRPVKSAKIDLTQPEISVAPDINFIVDLIEKTVVNVIETQLELSGKCRMVHKGSTARGVSLDNLEFDFDPLFDNPQDYDLFLKRLPVILGALSRKWELNGVHILSEDSHTQYPWGRLINLIAEDKDGIVFRVQLLAGRDRKGWNDFIDGQIAQIKAIGGSWEYVSGQIILFKRLIRDVLHSYGKSYGGLDGMMCVEFIVQADSSAECGRKITGVGSFGKTMRWIYKIGFDQASSAIIPFNAATKQTGIYSPDPKKLPISCSPVFWNKLVNAAKRYVGLGKAEMSEDEFAGLGINPDRIQDRIYEVI